MRLGKRLKASDDAQQALKQIADNLPPGEERDAAEIAYARQTCAGLALWLSDAALVHSPKSIQAEFKVEFEAETRRRSQLTKTERKSENRARARIKRIMRQEMGD